MKDATEAFEIGFRLGVEEARRLKHKTEQEILDDFAKLGDRIKSMTVKELEELAGGTSE